MSATVGQLREWLATLPPEFDDADVQSCVAGGPSGIKRIIAYRYRDGSGNGVVPPQDGLRETANTPMSEPTT